jgi:hypothetical protein
MSDKLGHLMAFGQKNLGFTHFVGRQKRPQVQRCVSEPLIASGVHDKPASLQIIPWRLV